MPDDIQSLRITLTSIHVNDDEDWFGKGDLYFEGDIEGVAIPRSQTFSAGSGEDIALVGAAWQRIINVTGKSSITITLTGTDDDLIWDDPLGTVRAVIRMDAAGHWPRGSQSKTSENPDDFVLYYTVEPILTLNPARPETAVVSRVVAGGLTATTLSGVPVRVLKIKATVPTTPPKTLIAAPPSIANAWAAPVDLTFESTKRLPRGPLVQSAADFAMPEALVLIRNSGGPIQLEAETDPPGVDVFFQAVRAADDAVAIGGPADLPGINQTGNATATLDTNQRGSFYVLAFLDLNRNRLRNDDEPGIILPLILVEAKINNAATDLRSAANPANLDVSLDGVLHRVSAPAYTYTWCRSGDFLSQATASVALDADILLVGGGPDGTRGPADRVFAGWSNNITSWLQRGTYQDGRMVDQTQVDNAGAATGVASFGLPTFISGGPPPNIYAHYPPPLLDSGRLNPALGGENITFTRSQVTNQVAAAPLGQTHTVIARDSPGNGQLRRHPDPAHNTRLRQFQFDFNSRTYLVVWTNTTGGSAPTPGVANSVGFRTYTVVAESQWEVFADYNITKPGANFNLVANVPQFVVVNNVDHSPGITPATADMEVRPPAVTATWSFNAST